MIKIVQTPHKVEKTPLSKAQKKFNSLTKKIDVQKKILQEWEETKPKYQHRFYSDYQPLVENYNECRVAMVHLLDEAHGNSFFKKTDKAKLSEIICALAISLIQEGFDELKDIYNRHSDTDFDTENQEMEAEAVDMMKSMMEEMFDMEFGDDADFGSVEEMREAFTQKMLDQQEREESQEAKRSQRKKTAKQLEKEAREKEDAKNASKSIQEVFRKLVAVLHPDREPDEAERERKTKLMQRVNEAYSKKDLLKLLALQLEIEQIDQTQLNTISEDRLKHFNQVLQEQLDELQQEINEVEFPFRMQLNVPPYLNLTPEMVLKSVSHDVREIKAAIKHATQELKDFQTPTKLKAALKNYRL